VAKFLVPTLASALGSFPLPDFLGLQLDLVDLTRNGEYMSLFFNLSAPGSAPDTPVEPDPGTETGGGGFEPPSECGFLRAGEALNAGQSVDSCAGGFRLLMQGDGKLVLFGPNGATLWSVPSRTPANIAVMRVDGAFLIYNALGMITWSSNTAGNFGAYLHLQDDGTLGVHAADGTVLWSPVP
jgi:hypothetical protein